MYDESNERVQPATIAGLKPNEMAQKPRREAEELLQAVLTIVNRCLNGAGSTCEIKMHKKSYSGWLNASSKLGRSPIRI